MSREHSISPIVRPALLFSVGVVTLGVAFVSGAIDLAFPGVGQRFGDVVMSVLAKCPDAWVDLFGLMFSVYAVGKTVERGTGMYTTARYDPPARVPDETEGEPDASNPTDPAQAAR